MSEAPQWIWNALGAIVPAIAIIAFWMNLSSRLTKAELNSEEAKTDAKEANEKAVILSTAFGLYREQVAANYVQRDVMREVEDRVTQAIDRLADRLDRVLERAEK